MAKKNEPYLSEEASKKPSKFGFWTKSRPARITAIVAGSGLALGAAFAGGVAVGHEFGDRDGRESFGAGFDREGKHFGPGGDRDGDHQMPGGPNGGFKMDDQNMPMNGNSQTTNP